MLLCGLALMPSDSPGALETESTAAQGVKHVMNENVQHLIFVSRHLNNLHDIASRLSLVYWTTHRNHFFTRMLNTQFVLLARQKLKASSQLKFQVFQ